MMQTCLVERSEARTVSTYSSDFTERLLKRGAKRNRRVLCERGVG